MKDFEYYGLFLNVNAKNMLMDKLTDIPKYNKLLEKADKIIIDHCTILHKSQLKDAKDWELELFDGTIKLNQRWLIVIDGIGYSDKVLAFRVARDEGARRCKNKTPHITIATFNGGKPVDSNYITNWEPLDEPIIFWATLKRV